MTRRQTSAWRNLFVPKAVHPALSFRGFSAPTPIQALTLAAAICDTLGILGAAETGILTTLALAILMIHSVLQGHKMKAPPIPSSTAMPPRGMRLRAAIHLGSSYRDGTEPGVLHEEARTETEAQSSDSGVQAPPKTSASASTQALLFCDNDAGEGPSSLVEEKPVPKQNKDREEKCDAEQTGKLKQELCNQVAVYKVHPRRQAPSAPTGPDSYLRAGHPDGASSGGLEIELEEEMSKGAKADQQEERQRQKQMKILKQKLRHLLPQPLFQENLKTRYPTQSGRPPQPAMTPRKVESALSCLSRQKRRRKKPRE